MTTFGGKKAKFHDSVDINWKKNDHFIPEISSISFAKF